MYLNGILREVVKTWRPEFEVPHIDGSVNPDGTPRMQRFQPEFELQGHLSDAFQADLEAGKLRGVSLESSRAERLAFGESGSIRAVRNDVKLKPIGSWLDDPMGKVREVIRFGRSNRYEAARISFDTADGTSHTTIIDTETDALRNDGYIKRQRLQDFDHLLSEACTTIDAQMRDKMNAIL
jgi:hypothetical protein